MIVMSTPITSWKPHEAKAGLPDSGFYPKISGFFEADGIFLGNLFLVKNLGKNLGNSQEKCT